METTSDVGNIVEILCIHALFLPFSTYLPLLEREQSKYLIWLSLHNISM